MAQEQVTQADRDAAASLADRLEFELVVGGSDLTDIRNGAWDNVASTFGALVQAFAAHRLASTTAQAEAAEKMAEALRELEAANERLCAERSAATYACMIEQDDSEAALLRLEEACSAARAALSAWESRKQ